MAGGTGSSVRRRTAASRYPWSTRQCLLCVLAVAALNVLLFHLHGDSIEAASRGFRAFLLESSGRKDAGGEDAEGESAWRAGEGETGEGGTGGGEAEPTTDINMKRVYDSIKFDNVAGGKWTQGWKLGYKGHEWDEEPLRVFVVPHSHNDPGWLLTVEQYYNASSQHILHTILRSLSQSPTRKFIWEEMSYLSRWWMDASEEEREGMRALVRSGQLEIVGGGWVMNDEANSHYYAIIEQLTEGNTWLYDTLGVAPTNSWAIDPFGHSATMPYLLRRSGFSNMLIQRTHYEVKKALAKQKQLEFFWRQAWDKSGAAGVAAGAAAAAAATEGSRKEEQEEDTGETGSEDNLNALLKGEGEGGSTDIVCHMMPFYSYDIPHTCGPTPGVCCQFDFLRKLGTSVWCPWGQDSIPITRDNVAQRAQLLVDQWRKKSLLFRTNVLLVPLGDDFRYSSMLEAHDQFHNYELLFRFINSRKSLKVNASFGTLEDYFAAMRAASSRQRATQRANQLRLNHSGIHSSGLDSKGLHSSELRSAVGSHGHRDQSQDRLLAERNAYQNADPASQFRPLLPSLSGDFFTYADRDQDYWSGYFTSRPFWKAVDRALEANLRAADILYALCWSDLGSAQQTKDSPRSDLPFPLNFAERLVLARRNLALFQHHDGITGTAKEHVVKDYSVRMHEALTDLNDLMSAAVAALLLEAPNPSAPTSAALNPSAPTSTALNSTILPQQPSSLQAERWRSVHDGPWERRVVGSGVGGGGGKEGQLDARRVVVFNPLEEERREIISVLVKSPSVAIVGQGGKCFPGQLLPEWSKGNMTVTPSSGRHRLFWEASVPPLGLSTYFIVPQAAVPACPAPALSSISVFNPPPGFVCPVPYACEMVGGGEEGSGGGGENDGGAADAAGADAAGADGAVSGGSKFSISNGNFRVEFGRMDGLIKGIKIPHMPAPLPVREQFALYASSGGAYLFLPHGAAVPIVKEQQRGGRLKKEKEGSVSGRGKGDKGEGAHERVKGEDGGSTSLVCRGPLVEEVHTRFRFTYPNDWTAEMQADAVDPLGEGEGEEGSEVSGGWLVDEKAASATARKLLVSDSEGDNNEDERITRKSESSESEASEERDLTLLDAGRFEGRENGSGGVLFGAEQQAALERVLERQERELKESEQGEEGGEGFGFNVGEGEGRRERAAELQGGREGASEAVSEGASEGVSEGASEGVSEEASEGVSEEELDILHPRHFEGKEAPGGVVWLTGEQQRVFGKWLEQTQPEESSIEGASEGVSEGASKRASERASEGVSEGASEEASEGASERASEGASEGVSEGANKGVSEEELDILHPRHFEGKEAPGGVVWLTGEQQRVFGKWLEQTQPEESSSEGASEGVSEGASERASEGVSEGVSEGASEGTSEGASERASEGASEGVSEGANKGVSEEELDILHPRHFEGKEAPGGVVWLTGEQQRVFGKWLEQTQPEESSSEGVSEGASEGASERASEGVSEGASEEASEGASERASEGASEGVSEGANKGVSEEELDILHPRHFEGKEAPGGVVWLTGEQQRVFGKWLEQTQPAKEEGTEGVEAGAQGKQGRIQGDEDARNGSVAVLDVAPPHLAAPHLAAAHLEAVGEAAARVDMAPADTARADGARADAERQRAERQAKRKEWIREVQRRREEGRKRKKGRPTWLDDDFSYNLLSPADAASTDGLDEWFGGNEQATGEEEGLGKRGEAVGTSWVENVAKERREWIEARRRQRGSGGAGGGGGVGGGDKGEGKARQERITRRRRDEEEEEEEDGEDDSQSAVQHQSKGPPEPVVRTVTLYKVQSVQALLVEVQHRVDLTNKMWLGNKELVVRYRTGIRSGNVFFTDLNGFQTIRRETLSRVPIQGNFYPMPALAFLQDPSGLRFSVHTRQAVGAASLTSGWLEMVLDRRLNQDDGRGLTQGVTDNRPLLSLFHLLLEANTSSRPAPSPSSSAPLNPSLLSHRISSHLNYQPLLFIGQPENSSALSELVVQGGSGRETKAGSQGGKVREEGRGGGRWEKQQGRKAGPGKALAEGSAGGLAGGSAVGSEEGRATLGGWEWGYAPLSGPLPCDMHIVSLKVHRPLPNASASSEPPIALLLHRRGVDRSFAPPPQLRHSCRPTPASGAVSLEQLFSDRSVEGVQEFPLNLVRKNASSLHGHESGAGLGKRRSANVSEYIGPMEIKAFKFWLRSHHRDS
ncbi:hypothetical protein CLOP_g6813 [Closterium sp. NIES-67]|nr:hypothetical protein CLOP_g6813 [Closterium sp. NIES-67]